MLKFWVSKNWSLLNVFFRWLYLFSIQGKFRLTFSQTWFSRSKLVALRRGKRREWHFRRSHVPFKFRFSKSYRRICLLVRLADQISAEPWRSLALFLVNNIGGVPFEDRVWNSLRSCLNFVSSGIQVLHSALSRPKIAANVKRGRGSRMVVSISRRDIIWRLFLAPNMSCVPFMILLLHCF